MNSKLSFETDLEISKEEWLSITDNCNYAWFWSTSTMHDFRIKYAISLGKLYKNTIIGIYSNQILIGIVPYVICFDDDGRKIASYTNHPLSWPILVDEFNTHKNMCEVFSFLDNYAAINSVSFCAFELSPPSYSEALENAFNLILKEFIYISNGYYSHCLRPSQTTLKSIRERYKKDITKFSSSYKLSTITSCELDGHPNISRIYMELHELDSGRSTRSLDTYELQNQLVKDQQAFWVIAESIDNKIVGMLLISLYKNCAFDHSVAVDPSYQQDQISHLLKWKAICFLRESGAYEYDLGFMSESASYTRIPSVKNYGISFFKSGWSRSEKKKILVAEKFYSRASFESFWESKKIQVSEFFFNSIST
jgi:hypothetical protein